MDYLRNLPKTEQEWMAKFIREYHNGNVKKGDKNALHKSAKLRKDCYQRKNLQNRDLLSILDSGGKMDRMTEQGSSDYLPTAMRKLTSKQRKPKKL